MSSRIRRVAGIIIVAAILPAARCADDASPTVHANQTHFMVRDTTLPVELFTVPIGYYPNPCKILRRDDAERALGVSLVAEPMPVKSADTHIPSAQGSACLYEFPPRGSIKREVAIEVKLDESGIMQVAFEGMGKREELFKGDTTLTDGRWDFVSEIPGGLTAMRAGRISMQLSSPPGEPELARAVAAAVLDQVAEWPIAEDGINGSNMPRNPPSCALLTEQEAEAVLGMLVATPYPSSRNTALENNTGASCAYMSRHHRALVLTPTVRHGAELFRMKGAKTSRNRRRECPHPRRMLQPRAGIRFRWEEMAHCTRSRATRCCRCSTSRHRRI